MHEIPLRACGVAAVVVRESQDDRRYLLLRRARPPVGAWTYAAGGIESGETAFEAAVREVREETGLETVSLYSADLFEQFYEIHRDSVWMAPVFVAFVAGDAEATINREHTEHRWCTADEATALLTFDGAADILKTVHRRFVEAAPNPYLKIEL